MRRSSQYISAVALACLAVGCAPKGAYQQASATGRSLDSTRSQLIETKTQISKTMASMDNLVDKPQGDLKAQFKTFATNVDQLDSDYSSTRDRVMDMRSNRDDYVTQWQTDVNAIQSDELKERARTRMGQAKDKFANLSDAINDVNASAGPLLDDIKDLRRYFGADLTAKGVKSAPDVVSRVHKEADATQDKIDAALAQIDKVGMAIAPTATTNP